MYLARALDHFVRGACGVTSLIILAGAGLTVFSAATAMADSCWNHNGSTMRLKASGNSRAFYYEDPKPSLFGAGVRRGTLLFNGTKNGNHYSGTARVFSRHCPGTPLEYYVEGPVRSDQLQVTVSGQREVYRNCQPTGRFKTDRLVFTHIGNCSGYSGGNSGYSGGNSGYSGGNSGYSGGNSGYSGGNSGYSGGNSGYSGGNSGYSGGNSGGNYGNEQNNEENNVASDFSCQQFGSLKSYNSGQSLSIRFTNRTSGYRTLMWLDYSGQPVEYKNLNPGESYVQQTFVGHPWMATDGPGNCKEIYVPRPGARFFDLTFQ